jgi:TM2 domain-containing membrane protein YozV
MSEQFQFEGDPEETRRFKGADEKFCGSCGEVIKIKAEICPNCGVRQGERVSKTALLLLAFFFGGIGAHKFYIRKYVQGVFYLLFCWTGIPNLIALIEFFIYAFTSSERLQEKYEGSGSTAVIAIVVVFGFVSIAGILAAIAIPQLISFRIKAADVTAQADLRDAAAAQEAFYADYKTYADSIDKLTGDTYGLQISEGVDLTVQFADAERYVMTAFHEKGNKKFTIKGPDGEIMEEDKSDDRWQKT